MVSKMKRNMFANSTASPFSLCGQLDAGMASMVKTVPRSVVLAVIFITVTL